MGIFYFIFTHTSSNWIFRRLVWKGIIIADIAGNVGSVTAEKVYSDVLFQLTEQEVVEMIHFHENGNIYIKTICELCQETLASYPEYYEYEKFLQ